MPPINSSYSLFNVSGFSGNKTDLAIKPNGNSGQPLKLEFDPDSLGYSNPTKRPTQINLSDRQIELQTLKQLGLNLDSKENLALVKERLQTGNPFAALDTTGPNVATYNAQTRKYEMKLQINDNLFAKLKGWAENVNGQTAAQTGKQSEAIAPPTPVAAPPSNAAATIKGWVTMPIAGGVGAERTLLYHIQKKYETTNLQGDNYQHIFDQAKTSGVSVKVLDVKTIGNQYQVQFEIKRTDEAKLESLYRTEQIEVNRQIDVADDAKRNSVGERFTKGFFKGAYGSLERNASMVYGSAKDPLGTVWKVGEALMEIPALSTRIGVEIGRAAVSLSKLTPEQRQTLVDELVSKGYTELRDMPGAEAAEKAGEIVGNLAMEAVLFKGVSVGGKLTLEGLQTLKGTEVGTAFVGKVTNLATTTAKTIGEVKVPVKATVQTTVDLNGVVRPVITTEKKTIGELLTTMEARAKQVLSGAEKVKAINLPTWEKLTIRLEKDGTPHLINNHKVDGKGYLQSLKDGGDKDPFPAWMTEKQIMSAVKKAYGNAERRGIQNFKDGRVLTLEGTSDGVTIRIHLNLDLKEIESAYPVKGGGK